MYDKEELLKKIIELYPDIGQSDVEVDVFYSTAKQTWVIDMKKGDHRLLHHLAKQDAKQCMDGKQCTSLGLEIAQLIKNIKGEQF